MDDLYSPNAFHKSNDDWASANFQHFHLFKWRYETDEVLYTLRFSSVALITAINKTKPKVLIR